MVRGDKRLVSCDQFLTRGTRPRNIALIGGRGCRRGAGAVGGRLGGAGGMVGGAGGETEEQEDKEAVW